MFAEGIVLCGDDEDDMTEYLETWRRALEDIWIRSSIWTGTEHNISYAYLSHVKPMECQPNDP